MTGWTQCILQPRVSVPGHGFQAVSVSRVYIGEHQAGLRPEEKRVAVGTLVVLAVIWAVMLIPPAVRSRLARKHEFLGDFTRMRLVVEGSPEWSRLRAHEPPPARASATQRRRRVLKVIGVGLITTLLVALVARTRVAWGVHLLVHDVFLGYLALMVRAHEQRAVPLRTPLSVISNGAAVSERDAPAAPALLHRLCSPVESGH